MKTIKIIAICSIGLLLTASCFQRDIDPNEDLNSEIYPNSTRERDDRYLARLYQEIKLFAQNDSCLGTQQFRFVAIGAKPCGGPTGYIAYNINFPNKGTKALPEKEFIAMVEFYNKESLRYLNKYFPDLISDCSTPAVPKGEIGRASCRERV